MQTVTIPEQEYLQMKQTIQALQQQVMLMQDKEFMQKLMQFMQVFMLVNQEVVQENKTEEDIVKSQKLNSLEQFKGGLANYQDITTTKTEWYEQ
jgi:hypothetical protein